MSILGYFDYAHQKGKRPDPIRHFELSNGRYTVYTARHETSIDISPASARSVYRLTEAPPEDSLLNVPRQQQFLCSQV